MRNTTRNTNVVLMLVIALTLAFSLPALADKPISPGNSGKSGKHDKKEKNKSKGGDDSYSQNHSRNTTAISIYFNDQQRNVIRNYYTQEYHSGHCPPGLAKKNNGCRPPGQVKKWKKGHPLPHDVVYYDLPSSIVIQLGTPPSGHRYVRVASDILLMAVGTGMIVDAIQDLSDM